MHRHRWGWGWGDGRVKISPRRRCESKAIGEETGSESVGTKVVVVPERSATRVSLFGPRGARETRDDDRAFGVVVVGDTRD